MKLDIVPYVGAPPFVFGTSMAETESHLGEPRFRSKRPFPPGTVELEYTGIAVAFDEEGRLTQMGFDKHFDGTLALDGIDLFSDPDALSKLLTLDRDTYLWVGFVVFMGLGVRLGGFHEIADEGKTVSIFERGRYDSKRGRFEPFRLKTEQL